ncbi:MAG: PstS family phosphate ABC transporter substrate-binding protein [Planctomycetes bacterium]|nr:PstS family phosphate ABC transporter substrate-binding protein [Planctomycetota bacterium]
MSLLAQIQARAPQAAAALVSLLVLNCSVFAQATVTVDGSSTVFPITEAVAEEFQKANAGVRVTVGVSGTGGGFKKFLRGEIDICDASRPIQVAEMIEAKKQGIEYVELPVAFDGLTVVINPKNEFLKELTVADLKKIWEPAAQGTITKWNQVRPEWPDAKITLYGAGSDSGTFDYFTEATVGKAKSSRTDFTASEDDNVLVKGVAADKNALGYFGYSYYAPNASKVKAVPIVNAAGKAIAPSATSIEDGSYNPLSRPLFIYVNKKSLARAEVRNFVDFYLKNGPKLVAEVRYVPLPADAYAKSTARFQKGEIGTAFAGHSEIGLHIDELFKRPLVTEPRPDSNGPKEGEKKAAEAKADKPAEKPAQKP